MAVDLMGMPAAQTLDVKQYLTSPAGLTVHMRSFVLALWTTTQGMCIQLVLEQHQEGMFAV